MTATVKAYTVQESAARFDGTTRVDRDAKMVRDVVVLGYESDNGRLYPQAVMEAALAMYDGAAVKIDHPELDKARAPRPFDTTWGWLVSPRMVMEDGKPKIRADLKYLETHPNTNTILERIEDHPDKLGLSHNADIDGNWIEGSAVFEVSAITEVRSVDLVENPATTRGIFESRTPSGGRNVAKNKRRMKLRGILEGADYLPGAAATISGKAVVEMMDEEGAEVLDLEMDMEDASSPEDGVKAGIRMAIMAVLDDESLSAEDLVSRIRELLAAKEAASGSSEAATEEEDEEQLAEATESKGRPHRRTVGKPKPKSDAALATRLAALEQKLAESEEKAELAVLESKCRGMLDKAGVEANDTRVGAMARCASDAERIELLKDWPKRGDTGRPSHSPSVLESSQDFSNVDHSDPEEWVKAMR